MVVLVTNKAKIEGNTLSILLPEGVKTGVVRLLEKNNNYVHLTVGSPQRRISTGDRSENNWIHGACKNIAEQLDYESGEYVKQAMKRMAVGMYGYPTVMNDIDGHEEPMSLAYASGQQAQMVIDTILDFCSMNGLWLIRYVDDRPEQYWVQSNLPVQL
jgi:hypothetical protein